MRAIKKLAAVAAALIILTGCASKAAQTARRCDEMVFAMDTVIDITVYGDENAEKALSEAKDAVVRYESLFSVTDENSDVYKANNANGSVSGVDRETAELVARALKLCGITGGALDISVYPIVRAWGFTGSEKRVPKKEEIYEMLRNVGYERIFADSNKQEITVPDGMQIDLGAVAKGYAGDVMLKRIKSAGAESAIINLGGNVQTLGVKPDGALWKIAVRDPLAPDKHLAVVKIGEGAVITSGGYERYFEMDGSLYHHIIDPKTGMPAQSGLISVTVVGTGGQDCGFYCDGLSTALFVMGRDAALDFWRENGGIIGGTAFELILVTDGDEVVITPGLSEGIEFSENDKYTVTTAEPGL